VTLRCISLKKLPQFWAQNPLSPNAEFFIIRR
jgi:hypothetical protein